jgi:teichuronic acid biosynthesis glycosyltransferase TuaG
MPSMTPDKPFALISVIIPFVDGIEQLKRACSSVSSQSNLDSDIRLEIVISIDKDNYSIHAVVAEIKPLLGSRCDLLVIHNTGMAGPGTNRNNAINASSGSIIAFLDHDDMWLPNKLSYQLSCLRTGCNFVSSGYYLDTLASRPISCPSELHCPESLLLSLRPLGTSTILVTRDLLHCYSFTSHWFCQDIILWLRLLSDSRCRYIGLPHALTVYNTKSGRSSKSSAFTLLWSFYSALVCTGLPTYQSFFFTLVYVLRYLRNRLVI